MQRERHRKRDFGHTYAYDERFGVGIIFFYVCFRFSECAVRVFSVFVTADMIFNLPVVEDVKNP